MYIMYTVAYRHFIDLLGHNDKSLHGEFINVSTTCASSTQKIKYVYEKMYGM